MSNGECRLNSGQLRGIIAIRWGAVAPEGLIGTAFVFSIERGDIHAMRNSAEHGPRSLLNRILFNPLPGTGLNMLAPEEYAARVIRLHGGHDRFFALMNERFREFNTIWDQDAQDIGRVLRSHLAVEHFLAEFLAYTNPRLGSVENARLGFRQKVELLPDDDPGLSFLKPGLRKLNAIRNRMTHRIRVDITEEDRGALLGIQMFAAMRSESARRDGRPKPDDPLSVVEQFAMFAASLLHGASYPEKDFWRQAAQIQTEDALPSPGACSSKAADGLTENAQE